MAKPIAAIGQRGKVDKTVAARIANGLRSDPASLPRAQAMLEFIKSDKNPHSDTIIMGERDGQTLRVWSVVGGTGRLWHVYGRSSTSTRFPKCRWGQRHPPVDSKMPLGTAASTRGKGTSPI